MPKRKSTRKTTRRKTRSVRGYAKVKRTATVKKQKRVVARAKSAKITRMPFLGMPAKKVIKMMHTSVQNYYWKNNDTLDDQGNPIDIEFGEPKWDVNHPMGSYVNDIYDPSGSGNAGSNTVRGFTEVSQHYSSWKVIGSKTTFKVRRLGPQNRWQDLDDFKTGEHIDDDNLEVGLTTTTGTGATAEITTTTSADFRHRMTPAEMGTPDHGDHMLVTLINRTNVQDSVTALRPHPSDAWDEGYNPLNYKTLVENKDLKGVHYKELRPGVGKSVTLTHKWKPSQTLRQGSQNANNGKFFTQKPEGFTFFSQGADGPPSYIRDRVHLNIIPFDNLTNNYRDQVFTQRFMVTREIEYMVLCFDKKVQNLG